MTPERRSVGLIGLGHMGSRIALKLLEAGHEVHVWDRGREAAREPEAKGARMTLAVNIVLGVGMEALAEAIAFGDAVGLERDRLLDGLEQLSVVSPAHKPKIANARKNDYPVTFGLRLMHKDFGLVLAYAEEAGLDLPATAASAEVCAAELATGREDADSRP